MTAAASGTTAPTAPPDAAERAARCPFELRLETIAAFLNFEIVDDPRYDGFELQWFDDREHGTGAVVLLSRKADHRVDVYAHPRLRLDPALFGVGAGIGEWVAARFDVARLQVTADGVDAEVAFTDLHGQPIEVRVDDRDGSRRRRGALLAPFGAAVDHPQALLLVRIGAFDLVRRGRRGPDLRIAGLRLRIGTLPGQRLHGRHLIKYGTDLAVVRVNPVPASPRVQLLDRGATSETTAHAGEHCAWLRLDPSLPPLAALAPWRTVRGRWTVGVDDEPALTGGTWSAVRHDQTVDIGLRVTQPWRPRHLPSLMRIVTALVPTFRRWPTTYRWSGSVELGPPVTETGHWSRACPERDDSYRRATRPKEDRR